VHPLHPLEQGLEGRVVFVAPLQRISTTNAPGAIGPYSQALIAGDYLFLSGQIAIDPATSQVIDGGIVEQTHQVLKNLGAVLTAAGSSYAQVVKTTVFLQDMSDFAAVNEIYGGYFSTPAPARSTIQAAALPRNVRVEIDLIAYLKA
jgi:2-iminobutanoate/2-iminopropanoate deaminase